MKTPDEIKKGLGSCSADECHGDHVDCPYIGNVLCIREICYDALAYIQQLEREKDALLKDLRATDPCDNCKYCGTAWECDGDCSFCYHSETCQCRECDDDSHWEWA